MEFFVLNFNFARTGQLWIRDLNFIPKMTENLGLEGKKFGNLRSKIEFQIQQLTTNYENMSYLFEIQNQTTKLPTFLHKKSTNWAYHTYCQIPIEKQKYLSIKDIEIVTETILQRYCSPDYYTSPLVVRSSTLWHIDIYNE